MLRRKFLRNSFASTAATGAALAMTQYKETLAAVADQPKKRVGLIGTGWYGKCDLFRLLQIADVEVVSLCDVDSKLLNEAADITAERQTSGNRPRVYGDYRKMLAEKDLDIVLIGTPDHWHALPMIQACQAGADVFVQKPISVDIAEGAAMLAAARKYNRVVQVGTQRRSTPHLAQAKSQIVDEGRLGKVAFAEIYCYYHMRTRNNPPDTTPPDHFDYEMWAGPAPKIPYNTLIHPRKWRAFMQYGNGIMGDMCIHMLDMVRWMLQLGSPKRVSSQGGILMDPQSRANISDTQSALFDFGDINVAWQHRTWGDAPDPKYPWGATIYGEKGTLKLSVHSYDFFPRGDGEVEHADAKMELDEYPEDKTEKDLEKHVAPAIRYHMLDFLKAIEERGKPISDIEEGHISTAACILANMSMKLRESLEWDAVNNKIINNDKANQMLARSYREPWQHPFADAI